MKKNYGLLLTGLFILALMTSIVSATCTYTTQTGGTDYFGVVTTASNITEMNSTSAFDSYTAFTPRLNFTSMVNETNLHGVNAGQTITLKWTSITTLTTGNLSVYNGTTLISPSNYTLNQTGTTLYLNFTDSRYNTSTTINYNFTRLFVKNVDDLAASPSSTYTGATLADFLNQNTPTTYGENKTFNLTSILGAQVNNQNWAVEWTYTEKACVDQGCSAGVNHTIFNTIATIFLIGMLVFIGFMLYNGSDAKMIVAAVIAFFVMLIALVIINGLITSICAT